MLYRYHCPAIEKAVKAGLKKFVIQSIHAKSRLSNHRKLVEILGINRFLLKQFVKVDGGIACLSSSAKNEGYTKMDFRGNTWYFEKHNISVRDLAFIEKQMSPQQIYYYFKRLETESGLPAEKALTIWRDYLSMAKKLGKKSRGLHRLQTTGIRKKA